jgi:hypothetical protein
LRNRASASGNREQLEAKVLGHQRIVAVELLDACRARGPCLQRQRCEVQAGGPALRSLGQFDDFVSVELDSCRSEQMLRFLLVHAEVDDTDFVHSPLCSPACKRQRRLFSASDRYLRARRDVLEQRHEHIQAGLIGDGVQIVEH